MIILLLFYFLIFNQKVILCENKHFYEKAEKESWWDQKEVLKPCATAYFSPRGLKGAKFRILAKRSLFCSFSLKCKICENMKFMDFHTFFAPGRKVASSTWYFRCFEAQFPENPPDVALLLKIQYFHETPLT